MTALGSGGIADIPDRPLRANTGPEQLQQKSQLFDHLVGKRQQPVRHLDAERSRRLEVDHQLELGRLRDRQIGGLGAFED
jgi:hypothetical protein